MHLTVLFVPHQMPGSVVECHILGKHTRLACTHLVGHDALPFAVNLLAADII